MQIFDKESDQTESGLLSGVKTGVTLSGKVSHMGLAVFRKSMQVVDIWQTKTCKSMTHTAELHQSFPYSYFSLCSEPLDLTFIHAQ